MVPLHRARVFDLGPDDRVKIKCYGCGHEMLIPPSELLGWPHVSSDTRLLDLERRAHCRECNAWGEALVSVTWG
jgi:hypothetical protein